MSGQYITTTIHRDLDTVIDLLVDKQQIFGMFQGESEWGPRALGNRSILFDPTNPDAKDIVNEVKKREHYRPFACTILEEHAHEYVVLGQLKSSPYMSFALQCTEKALEEIPSLVHTDNTCRIQTVNREQNKNYYDLIKALGERTGTPIVFNTSFNLHGEPIVETIYDAIHTCNNSDINQLYIPEDQEIDIPWSLINCKTVKVDNEETNRDKV
jgi:carbamoyltransferase